VGSLVVVVVVGFTLVSFPNFVPGLIQTLSPASVLSRLIPNHLSPVPVSFVTVLKLLTQNEKL